MVFIGYGFSTAVGKCHRYLLVFALMSAAAAWAQCRGNPVTVDPSDNLQALVAACPGGTTFKLSAGVHHDSVTSPKSDDVFTGVPGAVESGAKLLTGWKVVTINSVSYWTTAGGTPLPSDPQNAVHCQANYPRCWYVQDLYFDNADRVHVGSLDRVGAGTWYYDFSGDDGGVRNNIYLSDDPTGHVVELGARMYAFYSETASGITIQSLIIEKYAQNLQDGAVLARAPDWTIQQCEVRLNHAEGLSARPRNGNNAKFLNNVLHDNGQYGFGVGRVRNITVKGNTIYHNNVDHVNTDFGSGCCKVSGTDIMISDNTVYDNLGMGLWSDAFANGVTYSNNVVYGNTGEGIRVEVSERNTITNNTVYGNGFGNPDEGNRKGPQIHYVSSSHATITGNKVTVSANSGGGIFVDYNARREGCGEGCKVPMEMSISGNRITVVSPNIPAVQAADYSNAFDQWATDAMFDQNTYCLKNTSWKIWRWGNGNPPQAISFKEWQSKRQDQHAVLSAAACSSGP
jgi:parallel beta-helix repeat protein